MGQSSYRDVTTCFYAFSGIPKSSEILKEIFNILVQYGLLGLVLGLGLGFILYCRIWRPLALPYMCPQPGFDPTPEQGRIRFLNPG